MLEAEGDGGRGAGSRTCEVKGDGGRGAWARVHARAGTIRGAGVQTGRHGGSHMRADAREM